MMSEKCQVPEGYKKTELGVIPEDWEVAKLEDCCSKITDGSHYSPKSIEESEYKIATIANINNNKFDLNSCKNISKDEYEKLVKNGCKPNIGDVLFSKDGTVGLCLVHKQEANLVLLSSIAIIPPNKETLDSDFCAHMLKSDLILNEIIGRKTGTAIRRVVLRDLKTVKVPIPSLPEQQKIASILSKVDEQIEQTEQIIEKTEILKKGLMQKLLTKGIGHTKFKKTELGEIPEEWKVVNFGDICNFYDHLRVPIKKSDRVKRFGSYPYYGAQSIIDWIDDYIFDGDYLLIAEDGENLKSKVLPIAYQVSDKFWVNNHAHIIKPKEGHIIGYLEYILNFIDIEKYIIGSAQPKLNQNTAKKIKIPLPSPAEQQKIASILSKVDSHILDNQNYLTKLQELKKGLMQDLLTGKIRVTV